MRAKSRGFTLIELIVVVAIIAILATLVTMSIINANAKARDSKRVSDVHIISSAIGLANTEKHPITECPFGFAYDGYTAKQCNGKLYWELFEEEIAPYLSPLPVDPLNTGNYKYFVDMYGNSNIPIDSFGGAFIKTKLELDTKRMSSDVCGASDSVGYYDFSIGKYKDGHIDEDPTADLCQPWNMP